ncbi:hypothetical protein K1719_002063 [Acacia pycnantha]|nr:hypothetical protein K1719_002063 [Acacia pycnantha]
MDRGCPVDYNTITDLFLQESDGNEVMKNIIYGPRSRKWEAGPKPVDGLWAPWWYKNLHESTGFEQARKYPQPFPFSFYHLLEQSLPLYNMLQRHVKKKSSLLM